MGEWKEMKFSEFVDINPPITLSRSKEHFYIEMQDMDPSRRFAYPKRKRPLQGGSRFAEGDTLFARISPCTEKGNINQAAGLNGELGYGSTEFLVFRAKPGVSHEDFILYFSKWSEIKEYASNNLQGTSGRQRVAKEAFDQLDVIVPEVVEQRAIASVLSSLDAKIDLLHRQNKTLEGMAEALFRQWFVEEAEEGWEDGTLGDIMEVKGGTTPSTANAAYWDGEFCWTTPKDLSGDQHLYLFDTARKITEDGLKQIGSGLQPVGTLLLSSRAPVGYMAFAAVPMAVNQGYIAINGNEGYSNRFIHLWLKANMETVKGHANGSTFQEISKSAFKTIEFIIPPKERVEEFDQVVESLFDKVKSNQIQTQSLTKLRDTLLPKLMSGEVRVNESNSANA
ncbi:MAG: restriction endonuclease subunit S [Flavobacteriales bacterium]|nr:restriction endonuclease subunit S [Flavobacteriales bacterium]